MAAALEEASHRDRRGDRGKPRSAKRQASRGEAGQSALMRRSRPFVALWTLATIAAVTAFVLHLALRGKPFPSVMSSAAPGPSRRGYAKSSGCFRWKQRATRRLSGSKSSPERFSAMEPPSTESCTLPSCRDRPHGERRACRTDIGRCSRAAPTSHRGASCTPGPPVSARCAVRNLDPKRARWIRLRMGILCGLMGLGLGGFVSSAYRVQVEDGPTWQRRPRSSGSGAFTSNRNVEPSSTATGPHSR